MLALELHRKAQNILCLGAHADDIEIGCGGTLLKWISQRADLNIYWAVFSAEESRADEARASAEGILQKLSHEIAVHSFRTSFLPFEGSKVKDCFEEIKDSFAPDIIFTHYRDDRHQDHRLLADLTWNTFRNHLVLEYEIPKYDGDLGAPNLFVTLDEELARQKVTHLCRFFQSQADRHWFAQETFLALMRLRGMECASHYAEAFYCRKLLLA
ncbi:MAG TPA: PIG-L deacetylase family protein [Chthoniobacterales bacterium]|jgi:LmbE family N-acetylglucosaminyl deacetylase